MLGQGGRRQRRRSDAGVRGSGAGSAHRARHAGLVACAVTALALVAPGICSAAVTISPLAGTPDATPGTQISILGTAASNIESVTATGSISGSHLGTLESYVSSPGASFIPQLPFTEGEEVHVVVHLKEGVAAGRLVHDRAPGAARRTAAPDHAKSPNTRNTTSPNRNCKPPKFNGHHGRPEPRRRHLHRPDAGPRDPPRQKTARIRTGRAQRADDPQPGRQDAVVAPAQRRSRLDARTRRHTKAKRRSRGGRARSPKPPTASAKA